MSSKIHLIIFTVLLSSFLLFEKKNTFAHECISFSQVKKIYDGFPSKPIKVIDSSISLESAYCVQEKLNYLINRKYNDKIGYKVGFTGKALQTRFKIDSPAVGTLYEHMFIEDNVYIKHEFAYKPMIEPDLMVVVKSKNIMNATTNLEIIKELKSIHPFIEVSSFRFENEDQVNGNMLIAANMLATKMVMGEGIAVQPTKDFLAKISKIKTVFSDDKNNIIQEAPASNLMKNPINVVKWLIKDLKKKGISLKKGDRISLGSVGKLFKLKKNTSYKYVLKGFENDLSLDLKIN